MSERVVVIEPDCCAGHDPATLGYPDCCVRAFDYPPDHDRPTIHCYVPCDACLERAPLDQLWQEIVERRGFGCVNAMDHLVTYVQDGVEFVSFCPTCAPQ